MIFSTNNKRKRAANSAFRIPDSGFRIPDSIPSTNSTKTWRTVNKLTFTAFSPFFVWLKPQPHGKQ